MNDDTVVLFDCTFDGSFKLFIVGCFFTAVGEGDDLPAQGVSAMAGGGAVCLTCGKTFTAFRNADRHYKEKHLATGKTYSCHICGRVFKLKRVLAEHRKRDHGIKRLTGQVKVPTIDPHEDQQLYY